MLISHDVYMTEDAWEGWARVYEERDLQRYIRFEYFMLNPALFIYQFDHSDLRPLLDKQVRVHERQLADERARCVAANSARGIVEALGESKQAITRDRRKLKRPTVLRDQALIEPIKHHAWRH